MHFAVVLILLASPISVASPDCSPRFVEVTPRNGNEYAHIFEVDFLRYERSSWVVVSVAMDDEDPAACRRATLELWSDGSRIVRCKLDPEQPRVGELVYRMAIADAFQGGALFILHECECPDNPQAGVDYRLKVGEFIPRD